MILKLTELTPGSRAIIRSFENEGLQLKLMEMGCIPGETITMVSNVGEAVRVIVAGSQLSLRAEEAYSVVIELFT